MDEQAADVSEWSAVGAAKPYAGFWVRVAARLVDLAVVELIATIPTALIFLGMTFTSFPPVIAYYLAIALYVATYLTYFIVMTSRSGQTVGKRWLGLQVQAVDGGLPTPRAALIRALTETAFLFLAVCGVGLADPLCLIRTEDKRSLHDFAAGTEVRRMAWRRRTAPLWAGVAGAVTGFILTGLVRGTLAGAAYVPPTGSMRPTIGNHDSVLINRAFYRFHEPQDGDVIGFKTPQAAEDRSRRFMKRVVGVPGDRVCVRDGRLFRNGVAVDEPYLDERMRYRWPEEGGEVEVPPGSLIVLGDNRNNSYDSHLWETQGPDGQYTPAPFVPRENVQGKVVAIVWPPGRVKDL